MANQKSDSRQRVKENLTLIFIDFFLFALFVAAIAIALFSTLGGLENWMDIRGFYQ